MFIIKTKKGFRIGHTIRDITTRKMMMEEIEKTHRLESLGMLAASIAHDFKNINQAIYGFIFLAQIKSKLGEKVDKYLQKTIDLLPKAQPLTNQLLTFSRGGEPFKKLLQFPTYYKNLHLY
jgi:two-component system, cell cycle sensor histidine kinase and response regulator CckA